MATRQSHSSTRHGREAAGTGLATSQGIPEGYLRPQLRIGRIADYSRDFLWNETLNEIHDRNRRRGNALPLAGIACHYVLDKDIRGMLEHKYTEAHGSRKGREIAQKEYGGLSHRVNGYIQTLQATAMIMVKECFLGEHPELMGKTATVGRKPQDQESVWQDASLRIRPSGNGILSYGNKLSFDLSQNAVLYEERREVAKYLRSEENLDTRMLPNDWRPHATFFIAHPHVRADFGVMRYPGDIPTEMDFHAPAVDFERALNQT